METLKQRIALLTKAVSIRTVIISVAALLVANIALRYLLLTPGEKSLHKLKNEFNQISESHSQLKAVDMKGISKILQKQVNYLKKKQENIVDSAKQEEEIPLFIYKLEQEASKAGLSVKSSMEKRQKPRKKKNKNKKEAVKSVSINLSYTGSFRQVLSFLKNLETWEEVLLIKDFTIGSNSKNDPEPQVSGHLKFTSLIKS